MIGPDNFSPCTSTFGKVANNLFKMLAALKDDNACSVEVVHASKLPVRHHPAAGLSRLPDGGPCSVEVVHRDASKLPVRHHPAADRGRLSDGGPCSVEVVHASKTQEPFRTTCATSLRVHPAPAGRVPATDVGFGLSTRGRWAGPVICYEWGGGG
jgi:hypothetical protein